MEPAVNRDDEQAWRDVGCPEMPRYTVSVMPVRGMKLRPITVVGAGSVSRAGAWS
jgi:hypothetical protein